MMTELDEAILRGSKRLALLSGARLAELLERESAQATAVSLSCLPSAVVSETLPFLSERRAADALRAMGALRPVSKARVARVLDLVASSIVSEDRCFADGEAGSKLRVTKALDGVSEPMRSRLWASAGDA
jgi:flagellar motor switch protein FliG